MEASNSYLGGEGQLTLLEGGKASSKKVGIKVLRNSQG